MLTNFLFMMIMGVFTLIHLMSFLLVCDFVNPLFPMTKPIALIHSTIHVLTQKRLYLVVAQEQ